MQGAFADRRSALPPSSGSEDVVRRLRASRLPEVYPRRTRVLHGQATRNADLQTFSESPLTDSNRRPPPYHEPFAFRCPRVFPQPFHPLRQKRDLPFAALTTVGAENWRTVFAFDPSLLSEGVIRAGAIGAMCVTALEDRARPLHKIERGSRSGAS